MELNRLKLKPYRNPKTNLYAERRESGLKYLFCQMPHHSHECYQDFKTMIQEIEKAETIHRFSIIHIGSRPLLFRSDFTHGTMWRPFCIQQQSGKCFFQKIKKQLYISRGLQSIAHKPRQKEISRMHHMSN